MHVLGATYRTVKGSHILNVDQYKIDIFWGGGVRGKFKFNIMHRSGTSSESLEVLQEGPYFIIF